MKKFVKDYANLCKVTGQFYKEHWFGVTVMNVLVTAAGMAYICKDSIKRELENKFGKKDEGLD